MPSYATLQEAVLALKQHNCKYRGDSDQISPSDKYDPKYLKHEIGWVCKRGVRFYVLYRKLKNQYLKTGTL